jgi:hypothetical protein
MVHAKYKPVPNLMDRTLDWKVILMKEIAHVEEVQVVMVNSSSNVSWLECSHGKFIRIYEGRDDKVQNACMDFIWKGSNVINFVYVVLKITWLVGILLIKLVCNWGNIIFVVSW